MPPNRWQCPLCHNIIEEIVYETLPRQMVQGPAGKYTAGELPLAIAMSFLIHPLPPQKRSYIMSKGVNSDNPCPMDTNMVRWYITVSAIHPRPVRRGLLASELKRSKRHLRN